MSKINVDPNKFGADRYQMPPVEIRSQKNNKTYFTNADEVANSLNRSSEELLKYIGYALSTQLNVNQKAINGVYTPEKMQETVYDYIRSYVLCPTCNNPETQIGMSSSKKLKIGCIACGARGEVNCNAKYDKWLQTKLESSQKSKKNKKKK
jgi:translation initiation factor 5